MFNRFKPISVSLSPNVEKNDVRLALKLIFQPWKWNPPSHKASEGQGQENAIKEFEESFKKYLGVKYAFSFNSGRSAFFAILKVLDLSEESNVLLQAFTCNAVPNPILWAKLNPVYIDCNRENFNIDIKNLILRLASLAQDTTKTKVLVVQHTFGLPANIDEIMKIAKENNLVVIEDCAHALGAEFGSNSSTPLRARKVGTFGKAAFFSFSRDKIISCVYGGMAVTNDPSLAEKLQQLQGKFGMPNRFWIFQQIFHPIFFNFVVLPIYKFLDLGKIFLILSQWLHILSKAVSWKEKRGLRPNYFPKALPNALAIMAQNQFNKLDKFNQHRKEIAEFYYRELANTRFILPPLSTRTVLVDVSHVDGNFVDRNNIFLRFSIQHPEAHKIIYEAWRNENILLGDWYITPIAPDDTKLDKMKYQLGSCPNAEELSKITLNLPTHINISIDYAKRIVDFLKKYI